MTMRRWFLSGFGLALAAALAGLTAGPSIAAKPESEPEAKPAAESEGQDLREISGKVASVDPQDRRVFLRTGLFGSRDFSVRADTMILAGSQRLRLNDLKAGDRVEIKFFTHGGKDIAQTIAVRSKKAQESRA